MRDYDIESDLKQEKFQHLKLVQGDRGNKIKINVYEDGQPVNLTGCSITAKYKRADGQVINGSVINISNNSFDAVIDSDITKVSGTLKMIFSIEKDDVKVSTFLLLADVREGIGESTGGGEVTVDLSNYYKKSETYSKSQIDSQFKDVANYSLAKGTDGKVYIKKQDGTLIGNGIEIGGSDVDLSKISMSMDNQTLKLMNGNTQIATVEIPTAVVTDEQLTSIIQSKIDDGTLTSLTLGKNSVSTTNVQNKAITPNKTNFFKEFSDNIFDGEIIEGASGQNQLISKNYIDVTGLTELYFRINLNSTSNTFMKFVTCYGEDYSELGNATISYVGCEDSISIIKIVILENTKYIKFVANKLYVTLEIAQSIYLKSSKMDYTESDIKFDIDNSYKEKIYNSLDINNKTISNIKNEFNNVTFNKIIEPRHTDIFIQEDYNLFDINNIVLESNFGYSNYFEVENGEIIYANKVSTLYLYDSKKSKIGSLQLGTPNTAQTNVSGTIECEGVKYARISLGQWTVNNQNRAKTLMVSKYTYTYYPYEIKKISINPNYLEFMTNSIINNTTSNSIIDNTVNNLLLEKNVKPLLNKKIVWIGDSLTNWGGGNGTIGGTGFLDIIATNEGINVYNQGTAGASWELTTIDGTNVTSEPESDKYSAVRRVDTLVANKNTFIPDYIIFMMGTNRKVEGDTTDEYTNLYAMCGAIKHCLLQIYNNFPNCAIGIVLPPQRQEGMDAQEQANKKIKTIANYYSVPTFDAFHEGGLLNHERNPLVSTVGNGGFSDGLHLSDLGKSILGRKFSHWLKTL